VLGIETASRQASVAALRMPEEAILAELSGEGGREQGARLLDQVDACLRRGGATLGDLGAVAVSIGPGSFTGLRVGLATAKGIALGAGAALVGIATLEALALAMAASPSGGAAEILCPCLDARKGEVYAAVFRREADGRVERLGPDRALAPAAFAAELAAYAGESKSLLLAGPGAERYGEVFADRRGCPSAAVEGGFAPPPARFVALLGARRLRTCGADDPARLIPRYVRAPEAERARRREDFGDAAGRH